MIASTSATCPDCEEGLAHCHGVVAVHCDEVTECLGVPHCVAQVEQHEDVVTCIAAFGTCSCVPGVA